MTPTTRQYVLTLPIAKILSIKNARENLVEMGWIGWAILQATSKRLPGFQFLFNILIFIYFFKYETIETHAHAFLTLNILAIGRVNSILPLIPA